MLEVPRLFATPVTQGGNPKLSPGKRSNRSIRSPKGAPSVPTIPSPRRCHVVSAPKAQLHLCHQTNPDLEPRCTRVFHVILDTKMGVGGAPGGFLLQILPVIPGLVLAPDSAPVSMSDPEPASENSHPLPPQQFPCHGVDITGVRRLFSATVLRRPEP